MNHVDICRELRELADSIPEDVMILLPATAPSLWTCPKDDVEFENVKISGLLYFIADMLE